MARTATTANRLHHDDDARLGSIRVNARTVLR